MAKPELAQQCLHVHPGDHDAPRSAPCMIFPRMNMALRVGTRYQAKFKLGAGSFGDIYLGTDNQNPGKYVAIKLESVKSRKPQLLYEAKLYQILAGGIGIPRLHWFGVDGDYNVMVIDLLGPSLQDLFLLCRKKFSLKTVLMLADQMINRVEYMHHRGWLHRDIKPENILVGLGKYANVVHLVDFGLATRSCHKVKHF